jgi:hypothetical protein
VGSLEDPLVLLADAGEVVHGEEPSVVDLIARHPPVREPVSLLLQNAVQPLKAIRVLDVAVQRFDPLLDGAPDLLRIRAQPREASLVHRGIPLPLGERLLVRLVPTGQVAEGGREARENGGVIVLGEFGDAVQDHAVGFGIQRTRVLVVADGEGACLGIEGELQLPAFEDGAVVVAEDGEQDPAV